MKNHKLFYGWIIVAVAIVIVGTGTFFTMNAFSLFVTPLTQELGLSVTSVMLCSTIGMYVNSFISPMIGKLIDQKGLRFAGTVCGLTMGIGFLVLSFAKNFAVLCIGYCIVNVTCIGPMFTSAICSRWFKKYSGLANGIISAGAGLFVTFLSPVIAQIILNDGIGKAYFFSGACLFVTVGLVSLIFLRNTPEEMGQYPDGAKAPAQAKKGGAPVLTGYTVQEAMKTPGFWLVVVGFTTYMFADLSVFRTYVANIQAKGFDALTAAGCASIFGIVSVAAKLIYGYLTDKSSIKNCMIIGWCCLIGYCLMSLVLSAESSMAMLYAFVGLLAFGHSCWPPLFMKYLMYTCGVKHFGSVYGTGFMLFNLISSLGPIFAGAMFDASGSYNTAYMIFAGSLVVSMFLLAMVKKGNYDEAAAA